MILNDLLILALLSFYLTAIWAAMSPSRCAVFSIGLGNNIGLRGGTQLFRADAVGAFNDLQAALNHI